MKPALFVGLATFAAALPVLASAQPGSLAVRQVGRTAPSGLGNFGRVGAPFPPAFVDRHFHHRGGFHNRFNRFDGLLGGWGGGLYEDPEAFRDAGFFAGSADAWREGNRVHYDYDRAYPYDWYREGSARTALPIARAQAASDRTVRCEVEAAGVRVCRGSR